MEENKFPRIDLHGKDASDGFSISFDDADEASAFIKNMLAKGFMLDETEE